MITAGGEKLSDLCKLGSIHQGIDPDLDLQTKQAVGTEESFRSAQHVIFRSFHVDFHEIGWGQAIVIGKFFISGRSYEYRAWRLRLVDLVCHVHILDLLGYSPRRGPVVVLRNSKPLTAALVGVKPI